MSFLSKSMISLADSLYLRALQLEDADQLVELEQQLFTAEAWSLALVQEELRSPWSHYFGIFQASTSTPSTSPSTPPDNPSTSPSIPPANPSINSACAINSIYTNNSSYQIDHQQSNSGQLATTIRRISDKVDSYDNNHFDNQTKSTGDSQSYRRINQTMQQVNSELSKQINNQPARQSGELACNQPDELIVRKSGSLTDTQSERLAANQVDRLVAYVGYKGEWEADLTVVGVLPEFRRQGLGRSLVEFSLLDARRNGVSVMFLEVRASNSSAQRLYETLGFQVVNRIRGYYQNPPEDALLMSMNLTDNDQQ